MDTANLGGTFARQLDTDRVRDDNKLSYIDTMRGIAILMVIAVHTSQRIPDISAPLKAVADYGQMGVQMFFVASAFTLCRSHDLRRHEACSTSNFYIRRFFRIAPLYYIGIMLYAVLAYSDAVPFPDIKFADTYTFTNVLANILFFHGFVPSASNSVVPGGWSIAAEMSFYLVFPLIWRGADFLHRKSGSRPLLLATAIATAADLVAQSAIARFTGVSIANNNYLYFSILNQMPVFLVGVCLYFIAVRDGRLIPELARDLFMFIVLTAISAFLLHEQKRWSVTLLPTISAVSFVFLFNVLRVMARSPGLTSRIGEASFSMYIFHFIFAWHLAKLVEDAYPSTLSEIPNIFYVTYLVVAVALTFTVSMVSYRVLERRLSHIGNAWAHKRNESALS